MVGAGPYNFMCEAQGANFGFRRSVPIFLGHQCRCSVFIACIAFRGLASVVGAIPRMTGALLNIGGFVFSVLAVHWARPKPAKIERSRGLRPLHISAGRRCSSGLIQKHGNDHH